MVQLYEVSRQLFKGFLKLWLQMIENNDYLYLIMEYCSGGELFQHIVKNRRLKEEEACKMYA